MNITGVLVKPEAWERRTEVLEDLAKQGFRVLNTFTKKLTLQDIQAIYFQSSSDFMRLANAAYLDKCVLAAVLEGNDAQRRIVEAVGHHYNPELCADGTLRRKYAAPAWNFDGEVFFANSVHRPQGELDNEKFLIWFIENIEGQSS